MVFFMIRVFFLIFLFMSNNSSAGLYPVMVDIKTQITSSTSATYYISQQLVEIGDASEIPIPGYGYIIMGHRHFRSEKQSYWTPGQDQVYAVASTGTVGEAARKLYMERGRQKNTLSHMNGPNEFGECVGYAWGISAPIVEPFESAILPAGTCIKVPPGPEWCKMTTPELRIDHGILSLENSEGNKASGNIVIECTVGMTIKLSLIGSDGRINLGSGYSKIKANNLDLNKMLPLNKGSNSVVIESELHGVSTEGFFSGSAVMIIQPA
ncbi:PapG chaperone-binding domain-containing protein [Serratia plymuthica]|uniref:MrpH family fimbial adhesin n=1 Tax=Serratia plymuthica TaxID=82996 RepID=UPI003DA63900